MKSKLRFLIGVLVAALLLYFFVRSADWKAVLTSVEGANPWVLVVVVAAQVPLFFLRALRWQCFLAPIKKIRMQPLISSIMIGFMITMVFPGRLGEFVRPVLLGVREKISKTSAFATIVLERLFDFLAILVLLQVYVVLAPYAGPPAPGAEPILRTVRRLGLLALLGGIAVVVLIVLFKVKADFTTRLFRRLTGFLPSSLQKKLLHFIQSFLAGLNVYHDLRTFALIGLYSLLLWTGICSSIWLCVRAFHIDLPYLLIFPIQAVLMIGVAIPTPGMVGGFHAGMKIGLVQMAGVDPSSAVSVALVLHVLLVLPVILWGLFHAWQEGFSLGQIRDMGEREKAAESTGGDETDKIEDRGI